MNLKDFILNQVGKINPIGAILLDIQYERTKSAIKNRMKDFSFNPIKQYEAVTTRLRIRGPGLTRINPTQTISGINTMSNNTNFNWWNNSPFNTGGTDTWYVTGTGMNVTVQSTDPIVFHMGAVDRSASPAKPIVLRIQNGYVYLIEINSHGQEVTRFSFPAEKLLDFQVMDSNTSLNTEQVNIKMLQADLIASQAQYLATQMALQELQRTLQLQVQQQTAVLQNRVDSMTTDFKMMHTAMTEAIAEKEALLKEKAEREKYLDRFAIDE